MPRNKLLYERFKVKKWKWYIVDLRDYHNPVLIRKHLDNRAQAIRFKEKYYDKNFDVINWKKALRYGLRDFINLKRQHRWHTAKYSYPPGCNTKHKRRMFRKVERKKMRQLKRLPKVTETAVWEILDDKPTLFVKRLKYYRDNHWAYSEPVEGLIYFKKKYLWPKDIRHLCNIVRVLKEYYDLGAYDTAQVAIFIYEKWRRKIIKYCEDVRAIPRDHDKIIAEFKARGFIEKSQSTFKRSDAFVESIYIKPTLVHPTQCWFLGKDMSLYKHRVYDLQGWVGIPGFTRAHTGY